MRLHSSLFVYTYLGSEVVLCGQFAHDNGVGRFSYDPSYLENPDAHPIDPEHLPLRTGIHATEREGGFFGAFLDCCPQEWGQRVMHLLGRRFLNGGGLDDMLAEGLSDPHNMMIYGSGFGTGSLRFGMSPGMTDIELEPDFCDVGVNDVARVREIGEILARAEDNRPLTDDEKAVLVPGMSLGGARPKALVSDGGDLWIAKFYRAREHVDIQRVEFMVNAMAERAGIRVAESRIETVVVDGVERTIFMSKRFDRRNGVPVHYISAASVLGAPRSAGAVNGVKIDIAQAQGQYGYADIAFAMRTMSSSVRDDLHQLYRRMVFNVMVGNRDDHLCNHGFLLDAVGPYYRLSPAFDLAIVPNAPAMHPINVGKEKGRQGTISNLLSSASEFGLRREQALDVIREVGSVIKEWPRYLATYKISELDAEWVRGLMMDQIDARIEGAEKGRSIKEIPRLVPGGLVPR